MKILLIAILSINLLGGVIMNDLKNNKFNVDFNIGKEQYKCLNEVVLYHNTPVYNKDGTFLTCTIGKPIVKTQVVRFNDTVKTYTYEVIVNYK